MARIQEGIALVHAGEREAARAHLSAIWPELGEDAALARCVLAHFLADVQDEPARELAWDLRALEAARTLTDAEVRDFEPSLSCATFFPSLHLNAAESYRAVGDTANARAQLELARSAVAVLGDDGWGRTLRGGIARLAERLEGTCPP